MNRPPAVRPLPDERELLRRCEARLAGLELPVPFDVDAFAALLSRRRGRPIVLRAVGDPAAPCGAWLATPSLDVILFQRMTSPLHQQHIVLHELSHLLCGHRPAPVAESETVRAVLPHVSPETIRWMLGRADYAAADEREAELLASLILERAAVVESGVSRPGAGERGGPDAAPLRRLEAALDGAGAGD